jgi:hypothetical protein
VAAGYSVRGGHTWRSVSRVLQVPLSELGEHSYQESGARIPHAIPTVVLRQHPNDWLFSSSCYVPWVQPRGSDRARQTTTTGDDWDTCNRALTRTFVDHEDLAQPEEWRIGKASIRRWRGGHRTAFHTWALNGRALASSGSPGRYIDRLAELVELALHPS